MLWSAIVHGNNIVTIGYGENNSDLISRRSGIKEGLKEMILISESKDQTNKRRDVKEIFLDEDDDINFIDAMIHDRETFVSLLKEKNILYIEPANYHYYSNGVQKMNDSSGCGEDSEVIYKEDYTVITPNAKVPWSFYAHNIPQAWEYSTGSDITIGIVDTGISANQSLLGSDFNNGFSHGRTIKKYSTI